MNNSVQKLMFFASKSMTNLSIEESCRREIREKIKRDRLEM